jgi:glucose-6-phosphate-specific signal transduction histidine kinase
MRCRKKEFNIRTCRRERKKELDLPEETMKDAMDDDDFEIYNNKEKKQEEVTDYKEVQEEELHQIEKPTQTKEIVIIMRPSKYPLFPEAEDNNFGDKES